MIPVVVRDTTDTLYQRAIHPHTGVELVLDSATVSIYSESGTLLVSAGACTVSGSQASRSQTWPEATYPITRPSRYYRAEWAMVSGGVTYPQTSYFEVMSRRFRRPVGETDFAAKYPYLATIIPTGATLAQYLTAAWDRIGSWLYARLGAYPGQLFYPEQLSECLELYALADIHRSIMLTPGSEDAEKARLYQDLAQQALDRAISMARVHETDDKDSALSHYGVFSNTPIVR